MWHITQGIAGLLEVRHVNPQRASVPQIPHSEGCQAKSTKTMKLIGWIHIDMNTLRRLMSTTTSTDFNYRSTDFSEGRWTAEL